MRLPNAARSIVEESKVVDYLLSAHHPDGRAKAAFFAAFGFRAQRWRNFARALRAHGASGEVSGMSESGYGTRYSVDGVIETPDGRNPQVRTVWIVDSQRRAPRLVTAYPLRSPMLEGRPDA